MQINKGGLLPGQRTYEFRHVLRRVEHEHARRLAIQPETVGQPLPPGTGGQLQVGRRCGPRNRQCHAIGDEPASRRIRPQGLHGLGARAGNAPAVKANVAASARRHISATEPKRDAARAPPREHDVARTGTGVTSRPPPSANRLSAVATSCHAASQSMDSAGRPQGLGRLQQLTHGARAFLRNLRYPPPRQARGADTTLRVRIIPCMSRPAQHLDLATDAQTGKRRWHSDRRIGAHLQQPGLAQPIVAQDWLAADADPPRATCATPRTTPLRTSCKDMACPRAAVMAALRLELPSCMAASCARPRPSAACSNNVSKDSNSTDSIKACPRCAASGRHTSLMACPPGLPPQARQQPAGPANTGGTRWQARLAHPGSATAGRNRSAPCWTP